MSILSKLSRINERNSAVLSSAHELAGLEHELRLRYLTAIALGIAIDREENTAEIDAFNGIASAMNIDEDDAREILTERASINEEDLESIFNFLIQQECINYYLRDLIWVICIDHEKDSEEVRFLEEISTLLNVPQETIDALYILMSGVRISSKEAIGFDVLEAINIDPKLYQAVLPLLKRLYSTDILFDERWLDNKDGTWTDLKTGMIWMRVESSCFFDGHRRNFSRLINPIDQNNIYRFIESLNVWLEEKLTELPESISKVANWRYPTASEAANIHSQGRIPEQLLVTQYNKVLTDNDDKCDNDGSQATKLLFLSDVSWAEQISEDGQVFPIDLKYYLSLSNVEKRSISFDSFGIKIPNDPPKNIFIVSIGTIFLLCRKSGK